MLAEITKNGEKSVLRDQFAECINTDRNYTLEQFIAELDRVANEGNLIGNSQCLSTVDEFAICSGELGDYDCVASFDGITDPMQCLTIGAANIYQQFADEFISELVNTYTTNIKRMFEMLDLDEDETTVTIYTWHHPFAVGNFVELDYNSDYQKCKCDGITKTAFELGYHVWGVVTNN